MAWTAPSTKTTGTLITAAIWNEQVAANMTFLGANHDHSGDAGDGGTITGGAPAGLILPSDVACPAGWTRVSAWDNKFIRGSAAYDAAGGGTDTHLHAGPSHTHAGDMTHTHTGVAHTHTGPSHTHPQNSPGTVSDNTVTGEKLIFASGVDGFAMYCGAAGSLTRPLMDAGSAAGGTGATGSANANTSETTGGGTTGASGTANTDAVSSLPTYAAIIFCKKD